MSDDKLINKELIDNHFGYFPTFHDNEVKELNLNSDGPNAIIKLYAFSFLKELNEKGEYQKSNECYITFCLKNISDCNISGFNYQNVLNELKIEIEDKLVRMTFDSSFGLDGFIICESIVFQSLESVF